MDPVIVLCILFQTLELFPTPLKAPTLFALEAAFPDCGVAQYFPTVNPSTLCALPLWLCCSEVQETLLLPAEISFDDRMPYGA